ncbi:MAG: Cof-type HAD-IIB family hydrolase [Oscillospiraceae bacterium]|jgi:Cof subfamily protein (haloacid dehalogenase superfamily)|nr:Cof-type HAD-IIB family hydrolase [Oscillospiraceae bacterium]
MTNIKLIATDLDDTLLRRDKTVSDYTAGIFRRLRERGILAAFATARSLPMVTEYSGPLGVDNMILGNGGEIFAGGELIRDFFPPRGIVLTLIEELAANPAVYRLGVRTKRAFYTTNRESPDPSKIIWDFSEPITEPILRFSFRSGDASVAQSIQARFPELKVHRFANEDLCDIGASGASKAAGVRILAEHFNISMSEIAAFGDNYNDVEMLRECGVGIAVENAGDECKQAADHICADCDSDGVVRWIEENLL